MTHFFRRALAGAAFALAWSTAALGAASGYALSPDRTSVEADRSQVFSARFLAANGAPAAGERVRFSNDACGRFPNGAFAIDVTADADGVASTSFTALQPGGTVCTVIANAGVEVRYYVITYRLDQLAIVATAPANPVPGLSFTLPFEVRMGGFSMPNIDVTARAIAVTGNANLDPTLANSGPYGRSSVFVMPAQPGDYDVELAIGALKRRVAIRYPAVAPASAVHQDLWWAGMAENGWGVTIFEHRDVLFVLIFAYDGAGKPTWYAIPSGAWNAARTSYTGSVYSPRGTPYYAYDASRLAMGTPVGTLTLDFADADHASMEFTIEGVAGRKEVTRLAFGPQASAPLAGLTDIWWGGVSQNGWGIAVVQQNASLFTTWYTFDAAGAPVWYSMSTGSWTAADAYEGRVYRTAGSPWLGAYDAAALQLTDVGSYRLRFANGAATFEYAIEGRSGVLALTRLGF